MWLLWHHNIKVLHVSQLHFKSHSGSHPDVRADYFTVLEQQLKIASADLDGLKGENFPKVGAIIRVQA